MLYNQWKEEETRVVTFTKVNSGKTQGPCTLYPPCVFNLFTSYKITNKNAMDDAIYSTIIELNKIENVYLEERTFPFMFHSEIKPLHNYRNKLAHLFLC